MLCVSFKFQPMCLILLGKYLNSFLLEYSCFLGHWCHSRSVYLPSLCNMRYKQGLDSQNTATLCKNNHAPFEFDLCDKYDNLRAGNPGSQKATVGVNSQWRNSPKNTTLGMEEKHSAGPLSEPFCLQEQLYSQRIMMEILQWYSVV